MKDYRMKDYRMKDCRMKDHRITDHRLQDAADPAGRRKFHCRSRGRGQGFWFFVWSVPLALPVCGILMMSGQMLFSALLSGGFFSERDSG